MKNRSFQRRTFAACAAVLLTGCAVPQAGIRMPGLSPQPQDRAARSGASNYKVLHRFAGKLKDGSHPEASLIDVSGVLYGTTSDKGPGFGGTVFSITASGVEQTVYGFKKQGDGAYPRDAVIDVNGTLYGTTYRGGDHRGTVFSVSTSGVKQILYEFPKTKQELQGSFPSSSLLEKNGTFYGTTYSGGVDGRGIVYGITAGSTVTETVLYNFAGPPDGSTPSGSLIDVGGTFYGTTLYGGAYSECFNSCGTVYSLTENGAERVVYSFGSGNDGHTPQGGLIDVHGALYGTTSSGGTYGKGIVYSLTTSGSEKVLYNFTGGADGGNPVAGLIDVKGTLYGTTTQGGDATCNCGVIYSISTDGVQKVLYSFKGGSDGNGPAAKLLYVKDVLYGTTAYGGDPKCGTPHGCGTVFALSL